MADILNDPVKTVMLIVLLLLEITSITTLVVGWRKAKKGEDNVSDHRN